MKCFMPFMWTIVFAILGALIGIVSSFTIDPIYQGRAQALMVRIKIEPSSKTIEESRNRWIWIRDGLGIKANLLADETFDNFVKSYSTSIDFKSIKLPTSTLSRDMVPESQLLREELRKMVKVDFTGADDFRFLITVKSVSPQITLRLTEFLFERLELLLVQNYQVQFIEALKSYADVIEPFLKNQSLKDQVIKMRAEHAFEQAQRKNSFQILNKPTISPNPIWPRKKIITLFGLFVGCMVGLAIDYIKLKSKK